MAVIFDNSIITQIQNATDIVDVISEHLSLERKGKEFVGLCPFHQDHKPSMCVNPEKQIFKCFACSAGGNVFSFIMLRENLSFPATVERLADRAGIKLEKRQSTGPANSDEGADPAQIARVNNWALRFWQHSLSVEIGESARKYIEDRKINADSVEKWQVGFAPDSWDSMINSARKAGVADKLALEAGLVVSRDNGGFYDKFRNRLMFPILDVTGRVVGFGGRTLGDDPAKYMNSPATVLFDKSHSLYGLDKARHSIVSSGTVVIVEGYTDVMMCHQFGVDNVVATLGTSFTTGHVRLLRRYAKRIVLVFDSDVAGQEAANRALTVCLSEKIDIKLAFVGEGKDPCDYLLTAGADAFREVVENASDVMDYKWARLVDGLEKNANLADRRLVTEDFLKTVSLAMQGGRVDPLSSGLLIKKISGLIGLSVEDINKELSKLMARQNRAAGYAVKNQKVVSINPGSGYFEKAQREILEVLLNDAGLFDISASKIGVNDFTVDIFRQIAEVLFASIAAGEKLSLAEVIGRVQSAEGGSVIINLQETGEKKGKYKERLEGAFIAFDRHKQEILNAQVKGQLAENQDESLDKIMQTLRKSKS